MPAVLEEVSVGAPPRLTADTRVGFRDLAFEGLERAAGAGSGSLRIDMTGTEDVDASGLGTLVVLQKRARERGLTTRLCGTQSQVRSLLAATKLESLFDFA